MRKLAPSFRIFEDPVSANGSQPWHSEIVQNPRAELTHSVPFRSCIVVRALSPPTHFSRLKQVSLPILRLASTPHSSWKDFSFVANEYGMRIPHFYRIISVEIAYFRCKKPARIADKLHWPLQRANFYLHPMFPILWADVPPAEMQAFQVTMRWPGNECNYKSGT